MWMLALLKVSRLLLPILLMAPCTTVRMAVLIGQPLASLVMQVLCYWLLMQIPACITHQQLTTMAQQQMPSQSEHGIKRVALPVIKLMSAPMAQQLPSRQ